MNRIDHMFSALQARGEKALVGFLTAGDPNVSASLSLIKAMCDAGLDLLELGVPFSDPTADGPVIQRSSARALAQGVNLEIVLGMARKIRAATTIPIVLFSYFNPILAFGCNRFHQTARAAGINGVLVVDLPPEEACELTDCGAPAPLPLIRLIAPTTPEARVARIADGASGFLYLVSKVGVTGSTGLNPDEFQPAIDRIRAVSHLPICVGFGISTPPQVAAVASVADGVVVGSAFERLIEDNPEDRQLPEIVARKVRELKAATFIEGST